MSRGQAQQGLALARGLVTKHAIKQVDRLLSNEGIDVDAVLCHWVPHLVRPRTDIKAAMDWTDFDAGGQTTIMLSLLTRHGRDTPLMWLTVETATLKSHRNEYQELVRLADAPPASIKVRMSLQDLTPPPAARQANPVGLNYAWW